MAQNTSDDPIVNAVLSPEGSRFVRFVLNAALENQEAILPSEYEAGAQALFANIVMNDILNSWNTDLTETANDAQTGADQVISTKPAPPRAVLALAYLARGLAKRKLNGNDTTDPNGALADFKEAVNQDPNFARGHAQVGNQKALDGLTDSTNNPHGDFKTARDLAPNHPAMGYFDWGEGRLYFIETNWDSTVTCLQNSVKELPMVWYNWLYLAAAQQLNDDDAGAVATLQEFVNAPQLNYLPGSGKARVQNLIPAQQNNPHNDPVIAARQNLRTGLMAALANVP